MTVQVVSGLAECLAKLNLQAFGPNDWHSCPKNLSKFLADGKNDVLLHFVDGRVVGYYLLTTKGNTIAGERLAVTKHMRNKKIGTKLIQRALELAAEAGKTFTSYTRRDNLGSFNLHMRCGMRCVKVDEKYLYLST